jgi:hypothetical protein
LHGNDRAFRKRSDDRHTALAETVLGLAAVEAGTTRKAGLPSDRVSGLEVGYGLAHRLDHTEWLVTKYAWRHETGEITVDDVDVAAAETAAL